eukprot:1143273-Prorocentrum_minimum.AAC.2
MICFAGRVRWATGRHAPEVPDYGGKIAVTACDCGSKGSTSFILGLLGKPEELRGRLRVDYQTSTQYHRKGQEGQREPQERNRQVWEGERFRSVGKIVTLLGRTWGHCEASSLHGRLSKRFQGIVDSPRSSTISYTTHPRGLPR